MKIKKLYKQVLAVGALVFSGAAFAVTPANTTITNTATLTYSGLGTPVTASVDVTVTLTPAAPVLSTPGDQSVAENQSSDFNYTITAAANGEDTYNLTDSLNPTFLASTSTNAVFTQGVSTITSVTLGATAADTAASIGDSVISVPSDGTADGSVNELTAGDTVVIGGNVYTILSVSDDGVNASITLTSTLTTAVAVGDLIAEQQSFVASIPDVGSVNPTGSAASVEMTITATSATDGSNASDITLTTVVEVTFAKYVRNVTNDNGAGGVTVGGLVPTYYDTAGGVTAESGDVLEYAIIVTAPAGASISGVLFTDSLPAFTTYQTGTTTLNGAGIADDGGTSFLFTTGVSVTDDTGGSGAGTVAAGESGYVTFQVIVD